MNTIKITINNQDFENVHIDTYGMLTGDSATEMEVENLREDHNNSELTSDDFDWTYDHPAIVKDFAEASINVLLQAIKYTDAEKVIKDITYIKSGSPKFYNYTSDWYTAEYTVDAEELEKYIEANREAIIKIAEKYDSTIVNDHLISEENMQHAGVCHIINNLIEADDYNSSLWEIETDVYYENTNVTLLAK